MDTDESSGKGTMYADSGTSALTVHTTSSDAAPSRKRRKLSRARGRHTAVDRVAASDGGSLAGLASVLGKAEITRLVVVK